MLNICLPSGNPSSSGFLSSIKCIVLAFVCVICFSSCRPATISLTNYENIKIGMTLAQVESIIGPGKNIPEKYVSTEQDRGPVVTGEEYYQWEDAESWIRIELAFSNGKVCDKYYWEPSL